MSRNKLHKEIGIILIVTFLMLTIMYFYRKEYQNWEKVYSIGIIKSISVGASSGKAAVYSFRYKNQKYKGSCWIGNNKVKVGEHYIVEIPIKQISKNIMLFDFKIPNSIPSPDYYWNEIPKEIIEYNRYLNK